MEYISTYQSPLGGITMASDGENLTGLWFDGQKYFGSTLTGHPQRAELSVFARTGEWLSVYFKGENPDFLPPLAPKGSPFRQEVWGILRKIPYGRTATYGEIAGILARQRGIPSMSAQAVGGAVGHNPISILIPCHRVVGTDGSPWRRPPWGNKGPFVCHGGERVRIERQLRFQKIANQDFSTLWCDKIFADRLL